MILNASNLRTMNIAFNAAFKSAFAGAETMWAKVATKVPSTTGTEEYGWLGQFPRMREWVGSRVLQSIATHGYSIKNKPFESTVKVPVPAVEDDQYGLYTPMISELGSSAAQHPDELIFGLAAAGFTTACYDGQFFFDTDHPVLDAQGNVQSVSNTGGGSGAPWMLLDTTRAIKPLILQMRKEAKFVAKDKPEDDNVFENNELVYGVDGRWNVGFGFWQMAYGSQQTLDSNSFNAAYAAMQGLKGDYDKPLGIRPKLLVCGASNRAAALSTVSVQKNAAGADNINYQAVDVLIVPWLA